MGSPVTGQPALVPVPTVADLVRMGLAVLIASDKTGHVTVAQVSAKGHDVMGAALLENGRRLREWDAARRPVSCETDLPPLPPKDDPWSAWE